MKSLFLLIVFVLNTRLFAQSLYVKSETEMEGVPAMVAKMSKGTTETWMKPGKTKTKTKLMTYTQTQYNTDEGVVILSTVDPKCVKISKRELSEDSIINNVYTSDVIVKKTNETKTILGYTCTKTIITYKAANNERDAVKMSYEMTLWICTALNFANNPTAGFESTKRNSLSVALQQVEGFVLRSETLVRENNMKIIVTATAISEKTIADVEFEPTVGACDKFMSLREYNAFLKKQNIKPTGWN
jgi:Domain of unknown function (DUF4412)